MPDWACVLQLRLRLLIVPSERSLDTNERGRFRRFGGCIFESWLEPKKSRPPVTSPKSNANGKVSNRNRHLNLERSLCSHERSLSIRREERLALQTVPFTLLDRVHVEARTPAIGLPRMRHGGINHVQIHDLLNSVPWPQAQRPPCLQTSSSASYDPMMRDRSAPSDTRTTQVHFACRKALRMVPHWSENPHEALRVAKSVTPGPPGWKPLPGSAIE